MEKEKYGFPPSAVLQPRAEIHITIPAIPTPAGMAAPAPNSGHAYIRAEDGTPHIKRTINFTPVALPNLGAPLPPIAEVCIVAPNPDYITDTIWNKLNVWVHNWFLQRIPDEHQHLWYMMSLKVALVIYSLRYTV
jgi:hypothetical protein